MLNPIVYAVPIFVLLILIELAISRWRGMTTYATADTITNIGLGSIFQLTGVFTNITGVVFYTLVFDHLAVWQLPANAVWVWLLGLLAYDFCYYWLHRLGHEVNVLWAAHVVHHSSEQYNLSVALRQTSSGFLLSWLFYLPLAMMGLPPLVFGAIALIDLLYQYWVHTRLIGRLGWFDRVFVSPANHRVHHGQNDYCLDRNYGGILVIWDRLFGTFADERDDEAIVYGIRGQLQSWSPLRANLHVYAELWRDCRLADNWRDRIKVWFMPPGWRPAAAIALAPKPAYDISRFVAYAPAVPRGISTYALLQFSVLLLMGVHFLAIEPQMARPAVLAYAGYVCTSLGVLSGLLAYRRHFVLLEWLRLAGLAAVLLWQQRWFGVNQLPMPLLAGCMLALGASALGLWWLARKPTGQAAWAM